VEWQLVIDADQEPSFVPSGETYGSATCYDLRDRAAQGWPRSQYRSKRSVGDHVIMAKRAHRTPRIGERNATGN
jgi:hypothetical protein